MKTRATVVCLRDSKVLMVTRRHDRWALPGGRVKSGERTVEAARREVSEETGLMAIQLTWLFQFTGFHKVHHVFAGTVAPGVAIPGCEIKQFEWFALPQIAQLQISVPTRAIVQFCVPRQAPTIPTGTFVAATSKRCDSALVTFLPRRVRAR